MQPLALFRNCPGRRRLACAPLVLFLTLLACLASAFPPAGAARAGGGRASALRRARPSRAAHLVRQGRRGAARHRDTYVRPAAPALPEGAPVADGGSSTPVKVRNAGRAEAQLNVAVTAAAHAGSLDTRLNPTQAAAGDLVLYTANDFAALSFDNGRTFQAVNTDEVFPDDAGFSGYQVVHYIPGIDTFVWVREYTKDASSENFLRLAYATTNELFFDTIHFTDLFSADLGLVNEWLDFPDLAVGANSLYLTANVYNSAGTFQRSLLARIRASSIPGGDLTFQFVTQPLFNFRVAQAGTYGVVATKAGFRFTPPVINGVQVGPEDAEEVDFTARRGTGGGTTIRLRLKPRSVKGGRRAIGMVRLTPAPEEDTPILLESDNPDIAQAPEEVVIQVRKRSVKFRARTARPPAATFATITAQTEEGLGVSLRLRVKR